MDRAVRAAFDAELPETGCTSKVDSWWDSLVECLKHRYGSVICLLVSGPICQRLRKVTPHCVNSSTIRPNLASLVRNPSI